MLDSKFTHLINRVKKLNIEELMRLDADLNALLLDYDIKVLFPENNNHD